MNFVVVKITVSCSEQICSEFCSSEDHCSINGDVHYFQLNITLLFIIILSLVHMHTYFLLKLLHVHLYVTVKTV